MPADCGICGAHTSQRGTTYPCTCNLEPHCPECGEPVWDGPYGHKLAKCWNSEGHESGAPLVFDTMEDE
jgi:hypothetical protein